MFELIQKIKHYGFLRSSKYALIEIYRVFFFRFFLGSYSQKGEDLVIDRICKNTKKGFYVDVGANDPSRFSNTKRFYNKGWSGINIEPNTVKFNKFLTTRQKDINLNIGISSKKSNLFFWEFFPDSLSTFALSEARNNIKKGFILKEKRLVEVLPLSLVLDRYCKEKNIDFISIDTEGYDFQVLRSNNWDKYNPKVICVEKGKDQKIELYLLKLGYTKYQDNGLNLIFLRVNSYNEN